MRFLIEVFSFGIFRSQKQVSAAHVLALGPAFLRIHQNVTRRGYGLQVCCFQANRKRGGMRTTVVVSRGLKLLALFLCMSCATNTHPVEFMNFDTGRVLVGEYDSGAKSIILVMHDGEVMRGKFSTTPGMRCEVVFGDKMLEPVLKDSNSGTAHATLRGDRGTVMEIEAVFTEGSGHGRAETSLGDAFLVTF
jgi:hypothetical protein